MANESRTKSSSETLKKNVRVAVRVRPINSIELQENARVSLTANERKRTIAIRNGNKEFGPFDKVYDTQSKQLTIYNDLVDPLVKNVLAGYNCTIFAYGQTSTGKTHTMEGVQEDLDSNHNWNQDTNVGIIPRALQHIFTELEKQDAEEFSVRVSYVELYNEELYDLLGRTELGHARLRIFEDSVRKGSVIISGLEEILVSDRQEVYDLLRKGAEKRRTASTQMNLNSSRSHTVFTITVVIRENTLTGEELIKQGKLNLIDLAGSENIGRSGSVDKRAREAGSINQSLLTLGRVITALTSGAVHVPYRESKLTRILQDSLGGKTITTIIATLSPASTNIEETISTLEYASSAKNIKNHPEVNQKLSQRALLKAYNEELTRVMRDLQAARDKTGFFVDRQNYEEMNCRLTQQNDQIEELSGRLQATCERVQMLLQDTEFMGDQYSRLYNRYKQMEQRYEARCTENSALKLELVETKTSLENHQSVLKKLQTVADNCKSQNNQLADKCSHYYAKLMDALDKIDSLKNIFTKNEQLFDNYECKHTDCVNDITGKINCWHLSLKNIAEKLKEECGELKNTVISDARSFNSHIQNIETTLNDFFTMTTRGTSSDFRILDKMQVFLTSADELQKKRSESSCKLLTSIEASAENHKKTSREMKTVVTQMEVKVSEMITKFNQEMNKNLENMRKELDGKLKECVNNLDENVAKINQEKQEIIATSNSWQKSVKSVVNDLETEHSLFKKARDQTLAGCAETKLCMSNIDEVVCKTMERILSVAEIQMNENTEAYSMIARMSDALKVALKDLLERELTRPTTSGCTPVRDEAEFTVVPVVVPNSDELLKECDENAPPRRMSTYRARDSLLEVSFPLLSPSSLKINSDRLLDDIVERNETQSDFEEIKSIRNSDQGGASNITRRRR